ncbi:uncharacterized, partial [Tachysurus ichikawai]
SATTELHDPARPPEGTSVVAGSMSPLDHALLD